MASGDWTQDDEVARAVREAGGPALRRLHDLTSGVGDNVEILKAVFGTSEAEFLKAALYEEALEQEQRPHLFIRKRRVRSKPRAPFTTPGDRRPSSSTNPFQPPSDRNPPIKPSWITEDDFASLYSAAEFAHEFQLYLDTHVTFRWGVLAPEEQEQAPKLFKSFLRCFRDWAHQRRLPGALIYAHENVPGVGPHSHVALSLPGSPLGYRAEFRAWLKSWGKGQIGREVPRFLRIRGPKKETPLVHWILLSYLCKSYDPNAVVVSARNAPDGRDIRLGDLIAWQWEDCGQVPFEKRVGFSQNLGPKQRSIGVPKEFEYLLKPKLVDPFDTRPRPRHPAPPEKPALQPFRSRYEDAIRDVRSLYPATFHERVTRLTPSPEASSSHK